MTAGQESRGLIADTSASSVIPMLFPINVRVQAESRLRRVRGGAVIGGGRLGLGSGRAANRQQQAKLMRHSEATVISAMTATASVRVYGIRAK